MATTYHVKVIAALDARAIRQLSSDIQHTLDTIDQKMSTYKPNSELSRFNQHLSTGPFPVSQDMLEVFDIALQISEQTGGAYDITIGPLVNAFGFGPEHPAAPPTEVEIEQLRQRVNYRYIKINRDAGTLQKSRPDVYCDLSSIAQGFGTDAVVKLLEARGIHDYMVEVSGEVRALGKNASGQPWQIAIEKPIASGRAIERVVPLSGKSLATSGDYRNYYEENGVRVSHTLDARTGRPITHKLASISVIHDECTWADAYATALNVLGPEEGYHFAVEHHLPALFINHTPNGFEEKATPDFQSYLGTSSVPSVQSISPES
ncbi:MAG: FAD:protein FMN transferase [Candidatus Hydrogenedentes bacterium]|nr:FAD:protein FMN transferase [Candidatus Hydrogenedentota bacterium]